jgi:hypothetical protein
MLHLQLLIWVHVLLDSRMPQLHFARKMGCQRMWCSRWQSTSAITTMQRSRSTPRYPRNLAVNLPFQCTALCNSTRLHLGVTSSCSPLSAHHFRACSISASLLYFLKGLSTRQHVMC